MELLVNEPIRNVKVKVGEFTWDGLAEQASFFVVCEKAEDDCGIARNIDCMNEQLLEMWEDLEERGCKNIRYTPVSPCPLDYTCDGGNEWVKVSVEVVR